MYKKLFNLMVLMISVLTLDLLTGYITNYIIHYNMGLNPYKFTAIAMLALVFVLVPAYSYMNEYIQFLVAKALVSGSNSFGKIIGLLFSFTVIFGVLFSIYLKQWFHISILTEAKLLLINKVQ
jgi:hypothetical protein